MLSKRKFSHSFFQSISYYNVVAKKETNFLFHPHFENNGFTSLIILQVCVCVCVCVCFYILPPWRLLPTARCPRQTWEVRINDLVLWIFMWVLLPSSFISVSENVKFHLQRRKLQRRKPVTYWREKHMIWCAPRKMIYNDIGYKSAPTQSIKSDEKMLKIRRLL